MIASSLQSRLFKGLGEKKSTGGNKRGEKSLTVMVWGRSLHFNKADYDAEMELLKTSSPGFIADKSLCFTVNDSGSKSDRGTFLVALF